MHPFELYKTFMGVKIHFSTKNFIYGKNSAKFRVSIFENHKNYIDFRHLSNKLNEDDLLQLFVSNLILNPNLFITQFKFKSVYIIKKAWFKRLNSIDRVVYDDLKKLNENIIKTDEIASLLSNIPKVQKKFMKTQDFDDIISKNTADFGTEDKILLNMINETNPETMVILDHLLHKKYGNSLLLSYINNKITPLDEYMRIYKYKFFLDLEMVCENRYIKHLSSKI